MSVETTTIARLHTGNMFGDAIATMMKTLTEMEKSGKSAELQMNLCVWPVLNEVQKKIVQIKDGHEYQRGEFYKVVGE